jgi:hypothetical protein
VVDIEFVKNSHLLVHRTQPSSERGEREKPRDRERDRENEIG